MSWFRSKSRLDVALQASDVALQADVATRVDAELRRWRTSMVPVEDPRKAGELRAKTLVTIGAAMRQAQLERQRSHQQRRWRYALSAAAVLVGLGGAVYAGVGYTTSGSKAASSSVLQMQAVLTGQAGRVWVGAGSSGELVRRAPLAEGARHALTVGDRVITQAGGEADLNVGANTQVQLHQRSELLLARNDQLEKRLALSEGTIDVRVEHGVTVERAPSVQGSARPKQRVVIETPNATVVVHGTVFSVGVARESGQSVTSISVRRGVVAVLKGGVELQRLRAGESWSSRVVEAPRSAVGGDLVRSSSSEPSRASADASSQRVSASAGDGAPRSSMPQQGALPPSKAKPLSHAPATPAAPSSTLEAENRLFRLAIDARNDGDDAGSVRYFDQLLSTYPKSALGQEAKVERFRALKRMGRSREAAREARRYLIEHGGNGFAEDEARDVALTPGR